MGRQTLCLDETVEYCRHHEELEKQLARLFCQAGSSELKRTHSNATTSIAPPSSQSISRSNNVLVEEAGGPDLARDERPAQDADEESNRV